MLIGQPMAESWRHIVFQDGGHGATNVLPVVRLVTKLVWESRNISAFEISMIYLNSRLSYYFFRVDVQFICSITDKSSSDMIMTGKRIRFLENLLWHHSENDILLYHYLKYAIVIGPTRVTWYVPGEPKKIPPTTFVDSTAMHGNFCTKFYTIVKRSNTHFITKFYWNISEIDKATQF